MQLEATVFVVWCYINKTEFKVEFLRDRSYSVQIVKHSVREGQQAQNKPTIPAVTTPEAQLSSPALILRVKLRSVWVSQPSV